MRGMDYKRFEKVFNNLKDKEKVDLWNALCDDYGYEEKLFDMDNLSDFLDCRNSVELLKMASKNFDICDDYFYFDAYNHLYSAEDFDTFTLVGSGDVSEIYDWLGRTGGLQDFAKEHDPDYDKEDWYDEEDWHDDDED